MTDVLLLKGLERMLDPTIANHDQTFLDDYYSKLKKFLLWLIKNIVQFCEKTIAATVEKTSISLKSNNQEQFKATMKTTKQLL